MTRSDDNDSVVLLNSGSQYLKNYQESVDKWICRFVEDQKQHILSISCKNSLSKCNVENQKETVLIKLT